MRKYKKTAILVMSFFILQLGLPASSRRLCAAERDFDRRPYIERHISATSIAFGLNRNSTERTVAPPSVQAAVDPVQDATLLDNVRPLGPACYNPTIGQIQGLRPTTRFPQPTWTATFPMAAIKQVLLARARSM